MQVGGTVFDELCIWPTHPPAPGSHKQHVNLNPYFPSVIFSPGLRLGYMFPYKPKNVLFLKKRKMLLLIEIAGIKWCVTGKLLGNGGIDIRNGKMVGSIRN